MEINVINEEDLSFEELGLPFSLIEEQPEQKEEEKPSRPLLGGFLLGASNSSNLFTPSYTNHFNQTVHGLNVKDLTIVGEEIRIIFSKSNVDAFVGRIRLGTDYPPYTFTAAITSNQRYSFAITESTGVINKNYVQFYDSTGRIVQYKGSDYIAFNYTTEFVSPAGSSFVGFRFGSETATQGVTYIVKGKLEEKEGGSGEDIDISDGVGGDVIDLLKCLTGDETFDSSMQTFSPIGKILYAKLSGTTYDRIPLSKMEILFCVWCGFLNTAAIDFKPLSRAEKILYSKIFAISCNVTPSSELEVLLTKLSSDAPVPPAVDNVIVGTSKADYAVLKA